MIEFQPVGFGPNDLIGPHSGLRVTFAQTRSVLTPDFVERADLRDNLAHLIAEMETGGYALAPASNITIAPDQYAATIDFVNVGGGSVSVAQALAQLEAGLYGFFDLARRTYIRRVELLGFSSSQPGTDFGGGIPDDLDRPDPEMDLGGALAKAGWIVAAASVIGLAIFFAPEIKAAARPLARTLSRTGSSK